MPTSCRTCILLYYIHMTQYDSTSHCRNPASVYCYHNTEAATHLTKITCTFVESQPESMTNNSNLCDHVTIRALPAQFTSTASMWRAYVMSPRHVACCLSMQSVDSTTHYTAWPCRLSVDPTAGQHCGSTAHGRTFNCSHHHAPCCMVGVASV